MRFILIPSEAHYHSQLGRALPVSHICIPGQAHLHSQWECTFSVSLTAISGEDVSSEIGIRTRNEKKHQECRHETPVRHILMGNTNMTHQECISWKRICIPMENVHSLYSVILCNMAKCPSIGEFWWKLVVGYDTLYLLLRYFVLQHSSVSCNPLFIHLASHLSNFQGASYSHLYDLW